MSKLTTHVLDTSTGKPASGVFVELYACNGVHTLLSTARTNGDGRCDQLVFANNVMTPGEYEMVFHVGDYFRELRSDLPDPPFLAHVVIRFGIARSQGHYHIPLLVSPWSYATYRGS